MRTHPRRRGRRERIKTGVELGMANGFKLKWCVMMCKQKWTKKGGETCSVALQSQREARHRLTVTMEWRNRQSSAWWWRPRVADARAEMGRCESSRWSEGARVHALYSPKACGNKERRDWDRDLSDDIFGKEEIGVGVGKKMMTPSLTRRPRMSVEESGHGCTRMRLGQRLGSAHCAEWRRSGPRGGNEAYGALLLGCDKLGPRRSARGWAGPKAESRGKIFFFFFSKFPKQFSNGFW
jgi:hypothetical protein